MENTDSKTASASEPASADGATKGPGQALRQARTDLRLNPEEVATQLHLSPRQILALEADDYEQLPQATYVRGYLRTYALFLGLSPEPIVDAYNRAIAGRAPAKRTGDRHRPAPEQEGQSNFGAFAVGGLILVLVVAWWQGREVDDAPHTPAFAPANAPPPTASDSVPADAAPPAANTAPATPPTDPAAGSAPTVPPAAGDAGSGAAEPEAAPSTTSTAEAPPKPRPLPKNARPARLVLNAVAESWAEVRDARGERLLYQIIPAGRSVNLEGMAPFEVFLGNVDGVEVAMDGRPYDASRHRRGDTARFRLKPTADAPSAPADAEPASKPAADAQAPAPSESTSPPLLPE